jgi:hypothetical protein
MGIWRRRKGVLALALIGVFVTALPAAAQVAESCTPGGYTVADLEVGMRIEEKIYAVGDEVTVRVRVRRALGDYRQPAEGVTVLMSLEGGDRVIYGINSTNAEGRAKITLRIPRQFAGRWVDARVHAWKEVAPRMWCFDGVDEYGYAFRERALRVAH